MVKANRAAFKEAQRFAENGYPVFPCHTVYDGVCTCRAQEHCDRPGKHPRTRHGLKDATTDSQQLREWHAEHEDSNWGTTCVLTSVADFDPKHGADSKQLIETYSLADRPIVWTSEDEDGNIGAHVYCAKGAPTVPQGKSSLPGVEVRGPGAYVMLPGSRHVSGSAYTWANGVRPWSTDLDPVPSDFLAASNRSESERLVIPDGQRDVDLTALAGKLRYAELTEDEMFHALMAMNESRCDPPVSERQVRKIARSIGHRDTAVTKQLVLLRSREEARRLYRAEKAQQDRSRFVLPPHGKTMADELDLIETEDQYAIAQIHPSGGNSVLVASRGTGKTTIEGNLVKALADGTPFLGAFDVAQLEGKVSFLNYELTPMMFRQWWREMDIKHPERIAPPFHLRDKTLPFWDDEYRSRLVEWLYEEYIEWLFIDPVIRASYPFVQDSNSTDQMTGFTNLIDQVKSEAGVSNLIVSAHTGAQKFEEGEERARNSSRLEDWADAMWYLTRDKQGRRTVRFDKRVAHEVQDKAFDLDYRDRDHCYTITGKTRDERRADQGIREVVQTVATLTRVDGIGPNAGELKAAVKGDAKKRQAWIDAAVADGYIDRKSHGSKGALIALVTEKGEKLMRTVAS